MTNRISYKEARKLLASPVKRRAKYRNVQFDKDGCHWHSKKEYVRWLLLSQMQQAGEISDLKRQVPFCLHANGVKVATYNADFVYRDSSGRLIVEDVKAQRRAGQRRSVTATATYQRNKRHLKAEYGLDIIEI